jgi:glucose-1-phosphate thymidylyltransferase
MTGKAVVLAAGKGTRMRAEAAGVALHGEQRAMAERGLKALIPFHGHPYLSYTLGALADAGIGEACLVVGPGANPIRERYERLPTTRLRLEFAVQERPLGTAHALLTAERFAGADPFLVINGDNYYPVPALAAVAGLTASGLAGFHAGTLTSEGNIPPERVAAYALVTADARGCLAEIVEKPDPAQAGRVAGRAYVSMTCWRFGPSVFEAARGVGLSRRGEYELPDAVAALVRAGECLRVVPVSEPVLDLSSREDVASVGAFLRGVEVRL